MSRLTRLAPPLGGLLCFAFLVACQGKPVPLSAQQGSTVLIPLRGGGATIGYGGLAVEDPQRGILEYRLETAGGPFPLITRGTSMASAHPTSPRGNFSSNAIPHQVFSLVDIPFDAPEGQHDLSVVRKYNDPVTGAPLEESIGYNGTLSILPADVQLSDGSWVSGAPTPFQKWGLFGGWVDATSDIPTVTPRPSLRLVLDVAVWAAEVTLSYPDTVINVLYAIEEPIDSLTNLAHVWITNDGPGLVTLHATGLTGDFTDLSLVFTLDDPAVAILDPAEVTPVSVQAWDQDGVPVTAMVSVAGIF